MEIEYIRLKTKKTIIELNNPSSFEQVREVYEKLDDELERKDSNGNKKKYMRDKKCYGCDRILTKGNISASRFNGHSLCRKCAKFP